MSHEVLVPKLEFDSISKWSNDLFSAFKAQEMNRSLIINLKSISRAAGNEVAESHIVDKSG
jgi:hypothetical protein